MKIQAIVKRKGRIRAGRGFSREELGEVKLSIKEALKLGIPVDVRRSTRHDKNIEILKSFLTKSLQAKKPPRPAETVSGIKAKKKNETKEDKTILNLTQVPGIGEKRAQQLKNVGIDSIEKLAKADPEEISKRLRVTEKLASKWIADAKQILSQRKN